MGVASGSTPIQHQHSTSTAPAQHQHSTRTAPEQHQHSSSCCPSTAWCAAAGAPEVGPMTLPGCCCALVMRYWRSSAKRQAAISASACNVGSTSSGAARGERRERHKGSDAAPAPPAQCPAGHPALPQPPADPTHPVAQAAAALSPPLLPLGDIEKDVGLHEGVRIKGGGRGVADRVGVAQPAAVKVLGGELRGAEAEAKRAQRAAGPEVST